MYFVAAALIGATTILVFFTFPETVYKRHGKLAGTEFAPRKKTFSENLKLYSGTHTKENLLHMFIRPIILLCLPPILWATLNLTVTIGFLVAITSNFASAFASTYNFKPWQSGLCFISAIFGCILGIVCAGAVSDRVADYFTKRNGGVREPEMRLPAIIPALICGPLGLVIYGVGIAERWHWMVPTIGIGLCKSHADMLVVVCSPEGSNLQNSGQLLTTSSKLCCRRRYKRFSRVHH